jgi:hypothetical protein
MRLMAEPFNPLGLPFYTANAEARISGFERIKLRLSYRCRAERLMRLTFCNIATFSWSDRDTAWTSVHRDDRWSE